MNLSSNISIGNNSVNLLNELHKNRTSLVSGLPKDVVNLIGPYLLSESFTKISVGDTYRSEITIMVIGEEKTQSGYSQAVKIAAHYNSTKINIKGTFFRIAINYGSYGSNFFSDISRGTSAKVLLEPPENRLINDSLKWEAGLPTIFAWKKMDLNEVQREELQKPPSNFSIAEYGENTDLLLLKTIEKIIELKPGILPEKEEASSSALAARSALEPEGSSGREEVPSAVLAARSAPGQWCTIL